MEPAAARRLLEDARAATLWRAEAAARDLDAIMAASEGSNADDEHDPEGATIAFERAQVAAVLGEARADLDELESALGRLDAGTYGRCEGCGEVISEARLAALPASRVCVACAAGNAGGLRAVLRLVPGSRTTPRDRAAGRGRPPR